MIAAGPQWRPKFVRQAVKEEKRALFQGRTGRGGGGETLWRAGKLEWSAGTRTLTEIFLSD